MSQLGIQVCLAVMVTTNKINNLRQDYQERFMTLHPLESLSADELTTAVKLFRGHHADEKAYFSSIGLKEPNKLDVSGGKKIARVVTLSGVDQQADGGFVSFVDVSAKKVLSTNRLTLDGQVAYNFADLGMVIALTKSNTQWLAAVAARGIDVSTKEALALIQVDPWPAGGYPHERVPKGHRAMYCFSSRGCDR
jgi:Cu2+-containing amine oxidase